MLPTPSMKARDALSFALPFAGARFLNRRVPLVVGIQLTLRCNFRCDYCTRNSDQRIEIPFDVVRDVLGEIRALGGRKVVFTGGEPLLYKGIEELVDHGIGLGLSMGLNTNGSFLGRQRSLLDKVADVTMSIDGGREVHDRIRGPGSFDKVIEGVRLAHEHDVPVHLTVVLHRESLSQIDELLEIARRERAPMMFQPVFDPIPIGRDDVVPYTEAYRAAIDHLAAAKRDGGRDLVANSLDGLAYLRDWPDLRWERCAGGLLFCRIQVNGDVVICAENTVAPPAGNVIEDGPGAFARAFRGLEILRCGTCPCANHVEVNQVFAPKPLAALNVMRVL